MKKIFTLIVIFVLVNRGFSQWNGNSTMNNSIVATAGQDISIAMIPDGNGGTILCWWEYDLTVGDYNIYAQKINASGFKLWTTNGIAVCTNPLLQHVPVITSDGNGGAIISWQDNRSGNCAIYAQKINAAGIPQWVTDGIEVGDATNCQTFPQVLSDGNGGAFISWQDLRNGSSYRIFTQRVDADGNKLWPLGGVGMTSGTDNDELVQIVSDGNGGIIASWGEYVSGNYDIYAQRINSNGSLQWGSSGLVVSSTPAFQQFPQLISDGSGGAIIVWNDFRNGSFSNLYAQKVDAGGIPQWALNGIRIAPNTLNQREQKITSDGNGGVIVSWSYSDLGLVYAKIINSSGSILGATDGIQIAASGTNRNPDIISDGGTGAIITWHSGFDFIFAQHINNAGTKLWATNGVTVSNAAGGQWYPKLVAAGGGSAIVTWLDDRNSPANSTDIFGSKINSDGSLANFSPLPIHLNFFEAVKAGKYIKLNWQTSSESNTSLFNIEKMNSNGSFESIGQISAAGNSNSLKNYFFIDSFPLNGTNFYRLKQTDLDGRFTFSQAVKVTFSGDKTLITVFPNPVSTQINVIYRGESKNYQIRLFDAEGRLIKKYSGLAQQQISINAEGFSKGIYFLEIADGVQVFRQKLRVK